MGWTKDKPRKPEVQTALEKLELECERRHMYIHRYAAQARDPQTPRRYTLAVHNSEVKPRRSEECSGPACSWFGRKKGKQTEQARLIGLVLEALKCDALGERFNEVLHEVKRRNR